METAVESITYGKALSAALAAEKAAAAAAAAAPPAPAGGSGAPPEAQAPPQEAKAEGKDGQKEPPPPRVRVATARGEALDAALVIVTAPLGVLKAGALRFDPPLPGWKADAVARLGFGHLNKVIMQFETQFWDEGLDYFGVPRPGGPDARGRCFCFWNLGRFNPGVPLLAALVSGRAARAGEAMSDDEMQEAALESLRAAYGPRVSRVVARHVTRWGADPFSRGAYSYVAVGASGKDYDKLALPVESCVLFAGEHTTKENPDTVGGAILTGMREAAGALRLLRGGGGGGGGEEGEAKAKRRKTDDGGSKDERRAAKKAKKESKKERRRGTGDEGGSGSGSGGEEEEEEAGGKATRGRQQRTQRARASLFEDVDTHLAHAQSREGAVEEMKAMWKGLMLADQGDMGDLRRVLAGCGGLEPRGMMLQALKDASPAQMKHVCADAECVQALTGWLEEHLAERGGAGEGLLLALLAQLGRMPLRPAMLKQSGLEALVRTKAAEHRSKEARRLAAEALKAWGA
ncbi:MAG: flavin-containing amine oxidoreductase-domain containing protein, partial [Monoraphidium minutum]